jgi:hypothetical protein
MLGLALAASATAQTNFTESGGVIVFEAENYSNAVAGSGAAAGIQWVTTNSIPGYSGTGYMTTLPNNGVTLSNANWLGVGPELDYAVNFNTNLTHYVWVRAYAPSTGNNLVNSGLPAQGTPASTNTGSAIVELSSQIGGWAWTSNRLTSSFPRPRVAPTTPGVQGFSLWMGETGMNIDRILLTTNINFEAIVGNCWHIPSNVESNSGGLTMRSPLSGILSNTAVFLYTGNQYQGSGNPGNQLQTGSTIFYRNATNSAWSSIPLFFWYAGGASGNNKYYSNSIPAYTFNAGDTVQYYFQIPYSDHLPTYVYGNDNASQTTELAIGRAGQPVQLHGFGTVAAAFGPVCRVLQFGRLNDLRAQVFTNSGGITLVGPDLYGESVDQRHQFSGAVRGRERQRDHRRSRSGNESADERDAVHGAFGSTSIVAQITFPYPGVMHYEVVDWGAQVLTSTAITAPSVPASISTGSARNSMRWTRRATKSRS